MKRGLKMLLAVSEDYIPRGNDDLVRVYGTFVTKLVSRYNRVHTNFEDLLQHTWMKLFEVDIIGKHRKSLGHLPKHVTGAQAATYLRLHWKTWSSRLLEGKERETIFAQTFKRDKGVCHRCGKDVAKKAVALEMLRTRNPERYLVACTKLQTALGVDELPLRLWGVETSAEGQHRTTCVFCVKEGQHALRWYPIPVKGAWGSRTALFAREDVERMRLVLETEKDCLTDESANPASVMQRSLFKLYLARAVHNIYANWCRTRKRRYQEQYRGYDDVTGRHWEDTLKDPHSERQEVLVDLSRSVDFLAGRGRRMDACPEVRNQVLHMLEGGRSLKEVGKKLSLRPRVLQAFAS
jgi:hypothetical protein